jgi:hypothetical protein
LVIGQLVLRLTRFKTSNGGDVHVVLITVKDADDDANFLKNGTDLAKFQTVSMRAITRTVN